MELKPLSTPTFHILVAFLSRVLLLGNLMCFRMVFAISKSDSFWQHNLNIYVCLKNRSLRTVKLQNRIEWRSWQCMSMVTVDILFGVGMHHILLQNYIFRKAEINDRTTILEICNNFIFRLLNPTKWSLVRLFAFLFTICNFANIEMQSPSS